MKRVFLIATIFCVVASAFAQTADISTEYNFHEAGDKEIRLSLSWVTPMPSLTADGDVVSIADTKMKSGFGGFIGFSYFMTPQFYMGGQISFDGVKTIAGNTFFFIPVTYFAGYQFNVKKFEFPMELHIGGSFETYNSNFLFSLAVMPSLGAFYRLNPEWSLGFNTTWAFLPQWYDDRDQTRYGNDLAISFGFHYHF